MQAQKKSKKETHVIQRKKDVPCTKKHFQQLTSELSRLRTKADVLSFSERETLARRSDRKTAVSRKMDQDQWKALRAALRDHATSEELGGCGGGGLQKLREAAKMWMLFPWLKGKRPDNWKETERKLAML